MEIDSDTTETENCIEDDYTFERLCLKVKNIQIGNNYLKYHMELKSYMGDLAITSLDMGNYEEWFPDCGSSLSNCPSNPFLAPSSISVSLESNGSDDLTSSDTFTTQDSNLVSTFDLILICAAIVVIILIVIVLLLIIFIVVQRRRSFKIPQPLQFYDEDD